MEYPFDFNMEISSRSTDEIFLNFISLYFTRVS
jgi:hypothetical protein